MKLDNSISAVVTGAASGLGEATARALANRSRPLLDLGIITSRDRPMVLRTLYLIAAALALTAATVYFLTGGRGEDVTVRVMLLGIAGVVLLALGLSGTRRNND